MLTGLLLAWKKFNFSLTIKHEANNYVGGETHTKHTHPSLTNTKGALTDGLKAGQGETTLLTGNKAVTDGTWVGGWLYFSPVVLCTRCPLAVGLQYGAVEWKLACVAEALMFRSSECGSPGMFCNNVKYGGAFCSVLLCFVLWELTPAFSSLPKMSFQLMWNAFTALAAWSALWWNSLTAFPVSAFVFLSTNGKEIVND